MSGVFYAPGDLVFVKFYPPRWGSDYFALIDPDRPEWLHDDFLFVRRADNPLNVHTARFDQIQLVARASE